VDPAVGLEVRGQRGAAAHARAVWARAARAPRQASGGPRLVAQPEPRGPGLALPWGGLVLGNRLALPPGDRGGRGGAWCGGGRPPLRDGRGQGARELAPLGAAWERRAQGRPLGCTPCTGRAGRAGLGAALGACVRRCELAIGAASRALAEAKPAANAHGDGGARSAHRGTQAGAHVTQSVRARHGAMATGQWPRASARGAVVPSAPARGVSDVLSALGGHCAHDEAGRVGARATAAAVGGGPPGAGAAAVQGDAAEPTEAAVAIAWRRQRHGLGGEDVGREPTARGLGAWGGEGEAVWLMERLGRGDKGVEITGRALVGRKREKGAAPSRAAFEKKVVQSVLL
jgi:hypothetical protein